MPCVLWFAGRKVTGPFEKNGCRGIRRTRGDTGGEGDQSVFEKCVPAFVLCILNN